MADAPTPPTLKLLGGFELSGPSGAPIPIPRKKSQALLAYLALTAGQRHPRDKLATLLWPDVPDRQARQSLRQSLSTLRQVLGPMLPDLSASDDAIGLEARAVAVDAQRFEIAVADGSPAALYEAERLYRGDLLEGLAVSEPPFEEWLVAERERLREMVLEALGKLLALQSREGQDDAATGTALRLLALDPLQEAVHRALMRIHARRGRHNAALRQYQNCVDVLQRELGAEPEPETRELYRFLLGRRAEGMPADAPRSEPDAAAEPRPSDPGSSLTALVGRDREVGELAAIVDAAFTGQARVVALVGEAGVGKSRLAAELVAEARRRGGRVLVGRGHPTEHALHYGLWVDALRSGNAVDDRAALERLPDTLRAVLARLFPEIGAVPSGELHAPADSLDTLRPFEAITRLVQGLMASGPLLVLLEDAHWADDTSLRLLSFMARRLSAARIVLAITAREDELDEVPVLKSLLREPSVTRISVAPLSLAATTSLVAALGRTGHAPAEMQRLTRRVWTASAGNPFVVVETMRASDAALSSLSGEDGTPRPARVRELVRARLERLSERARRLAGVSAVAGREIDIALLQRASGLAEDEVLDGVEELVRRRILAAVGERLDVVHDWVRDVIYEELLAPRRRSLHRQVAEALEAIHADDVAPHAAALGQHYRAAEVWDRALAHLRAAAARSVEHSAYREAVACYDAALAAFDRLADGRRRAEDGIDLRLEARLPLAVLGEIERIDPLVQEAERLAEVVSDPGRLGLALLCRAYQHWSRGEYGAGHLALDRAGTMAPPASGPTPHRTNWIRGLLLFQEGRYRESLASLATQEAEEHRTAGPPHGQFPTRYATIALHQVLSLVELGEFDLALDHARRGFERGRQLGHGYILAMAATAEGAIALRRGNAGLAVALLERARDLCLDGNYLMLLPGALGYLTAAYLMADRLDDALRAGGEAIDRERAPYAFLDVALGDACLAAGRIEKARAIAEHSARTAERLGERGRLAWSTWLLGKIHARSAGSSAKADALFQDALGQAESLGMQPLVAHCHLGLGRQRAAVGDRGAAEVHLAHAEEMYGRMGMTFFADSAGRSLAELHG